jgi:hypothetical protein
MATAIFGGGISNGFNVDLQNYAGAVSASWVATLSYTANGAPFTYIDIPEGTLDGVNALPLDGSNYSIYVPGSAALNAATQNYPGTTLYYTVNITLYSDAARTIQIGTVSTGQMYMLQAPTPMSITIGSVVSTNPNRVSFNLNAVPFNGTATWTVVARNNQNTIANTTVNGSAVISIAPTSTIALQTNVLVTDSTDEFYISARLTASDGRQVNAVKSFFFPGLLYTNNDGYVPPDNGGGGNSNGGGGNTGCNTGGNTTGGGGTGTNGNGVVTPGVDTSHVTQGSGSGTTGGATQSNGAQGGVDGGWSQYDSENLNRLADYNLYMMRNSAVMADNSTAVANNSAVMAYNSTAIANNTAVIGTNSIIIANNLAIIANAITAISRDISDLRNAGMDYNKGIVVRDTCSPCDNEGENSLNRAITITSLKKSDRIRDVITELQRPTYLPPASQNFNHD